MSNYREFYCCESIVAREKAVFLLTAGNNLTLTAHFILPKALQSGRCVPFGLTHTDARNMSTFGHLFC